MEASKKTKKVKMRCPSGYKYGIDYDKYSACDTCAIWDDCHKEAGALWDAFKAAYKGLRGDKNTSNGEAFLSAVECLLLIEQYGGCEGDLSMDELDF